MGLGLHGGGVGAARFFAKAGAKVLVTDLRKESELKSSVEKLKGLKIDFVLGQHRSEDFINTDLVIKNPAVSENSKYLEIAKKNKTEIDSDIGIFFELCKNKKIGITGTKGKSTTTKIIFELIKTKYKNAILAGNIRSSVLAKIKKVVPKNPIVLELSSWQLHDLAKHKKSPSVAVITNILNDHQNRYKKFEDYIDDKKAILKFQSRKKGVAVLNYDDSLVKDFNNQTRGRVIYFSTRHDFGKLDIEADSIGAFLRDDKIVFGPKGEEIIATQDIPLLGQHNLSNISAAVTVAKIFDIPTKEIKKTIKKFNGLTGRLEKVAWNKDRIAFNDTTATTPDATLMSIKALIENYPQKPITLILGGTDKKLDFTELAKKINELTQSGNIENLIFLPGTATEKIKNLLKDIHFSFSQNKALDAFDMSDAVKLAAGTMHNQGIILLSPGAASFGVFLHEFDRGEKFDKAIAKYFN